MKKVALTLLALMMLISLGLMVNTQAASADVEWYHPTYGTATVDGDSADWNLTTDCSVPMYRAGKNDANHPQESTAYLRYDYSNQTMYVLVLVKSGIIAISSAGDAWGAIDSNGNKVYTGSSGNNGTPPDFAWVYSGSDAIGYEASFPLDPGIYEFKIHIQVNDGGSQTSATLGFIAITMNDPPPQLPELPAVALFGLGLAGVGAIVLISRRRETASAR
jgi:hypothetical protein